MSMIIDGKMIAQQIKDEVKAECERLKPYGKGTLAVILIGNDPASNVYVRNKKKACEYVGFDSVSYEKDESFTQKELLCLIDELNNDPKIDGILVQLPLPSHIDEDAVIKAISPDKDVDGFHQQNVGAMMVGTPGFLPCTPAGIIELIKRSHIETDGKRCVVMGRSNIVGKPMSVLMLKENATVTVTHTHTKELKDICRQADILIAAVGRPKMVDQSYVKEGACVIDVGIHRDENNKLCGDVDFESVKDVAGSITPVPGGVGPMTIAMLMYNCLVSFKRRINVD